jgi:hypothetical protein
MKKIFIIGFIGLTGLLSEVYGQAKLSDDTIQLGGQTTLTVTNARLYPTPEILNNNTIEVVGEQTFDTAKHTQSTVLTSFEPGVHYVMLSAVDSMPLVVLDVDVDTTARADIKDIADIERAPYSFWEIFRWVLLGLGIIALGLLGWWLYTHRKKIQEVLGPHEPVDTRTPEERALDSLEELRRKQLWQAGRVKEYHTELTDIVRRFIEEATGIRATELTSDETIEAVERGEWRVESSLLRSIFTTADLVKFAKSEPQPYEHDHSMNQAAEFVKMLWQSVKPTETSNGEEVKDE